LYAVGASDTAYLAWVYVSCSQTPGSAKAAGACSFTIPNGLAPGTYELRLFTNDSYARLARSNALTVGASGPALSGSPTAPSTGTGVTATWSGIASPTRLGWMWICAAGTAQPA